MNKIELLKNHIKEVIHNRFLGNPGQDIDINIAEEAIKEFDNFVESQKDLIKGKDEHIARLLNQNKELRDENKELVARNAFRILVTEDSVSEKAIEQFKERFEKMSPIIGTNNVEIEYNRYKATELELGIDLIIFIKVLACKNLFGHFDRFGQYNKSEIRKLRNIKLDLKKRRFLADDYGNVINIPLDFNKFGITWGFTKEELEAK